MTRLFTTKQDFDLKKMTLRMAGAARFNGETFRALRADQSASLQSLVLAPIVGLCYGGGLGFFGYLVAGFSLVDALLVTLVGVLSAIIIALLWSGTNFLIVTKLFHGTIDYWGLTRPLLFSWAPGILFIFLLSPSPIVSEGFRIAAIAWVGIASVFAVKHAAGFSFQQSMLTFIMSVIVLVFAQIVLESVLAAFLA